MLPELPVVPVLPVLPELPVLPVLPEALEGGTRRRHSKAALEAGLEGFFRGF